MALVILDRDGVINQDSDDYICSVADWIPIPGSIQAIADLSRAGYRIAVATNQSGLSRGYFTLDTLEEIHALLCRQVEDCGGKIDGIFYCPHLPAEGCACRKPATGLLQAIENELDETAGDALFIGDSLKDLQAARAFGCKAVLVESGRGTDTLARLQSGQTDIDDPLAIPVYRDLADAASAILKS